jgi:uncharacterized protein (DUF58 family)
VSLTGRAALVALVGTLAAVLLRTVPGLVTVDGLIAVAIVADVALAGSVRQLRMSRAGDTRIMLGERGATTLTITNPGRRTVRGLLRDAWQPSLGGTSRAEIMIPAGGHGAVGRTAWPRGASGQPRGAMDSPGVAPVPEP